MASTDARLFPLKNIAYRVTFPILDADGDLVTGAAGLDSEISKDGGTFADCTNEATEIATSSGVYYLDLTATEMNADTVAIIVKTSTSGAKTTTIVMYPVETGDIDVDITAIAGVAVNTAVAQIGCNVVSQANIDFGALQKASLNAATPASVVGAVGSVTGAVGSVTGAVGSVTGNVGGNVTGSVGSLATQAKADVNAEVVDVLNTDANTELASIPTTTSPLRQMVQFLFQYFRNKKTITATTETLYKEDASTSLGTSTIADDGVTFSKSEVS